MNEVQAEIARKGAVGLIAALAAMNPVQAADRVAARHRKLCKPDLHPRRNRAIVNASRCRVSFE